MVKSHAQHTFEAKYLPDYRVQKILNNSTVLLVTSNRKERKININDFKLCFTTKLVEFAWDSFFGSRNTKH